MPFSLSSAIRESCEQTLGVPIQTVSAVGGGDINEAKKLETSIGNFFIKLNTVAHASEMFATEARGLRLLSKPGAIRVPKVVDHGSAGGQAFLLLEFIESGRPSSSFWKQFGRALAELHRQPQPFFGLDFDNFIGSLPQENGEYKDFPSFYIEKRLQPQLDMALRSGLLNQMDAGRMETLYQRLDQLLPEEPPALIHGDLWGGNFLASTDEQGVLIDPAVAYAHREMDLGMSRLFGGFNPLFYQSYQEVYPTEPGLEDRLDLYQLYYLLVHVNLFGSGYSGSVRRILKKYGK